MCITPTSSFAQTSDAVSQPNPLLTNPSSFSLLKLPAYLPGFHSGSTILAPSEGAGSFDCTFAGWLDPLSHDRTCPHCGHQMNIKAPRTVLLRHVPIGHWHTFIQVNLKQFECPHCGKTHVQEIPFKALHHRITNGLLNYIIGLLSMHTCTHRHIAEITGVSKNVVKDIDYERLKGLYTTDGKTLLKPGRFCRHLAIDEFLLHRGHRYATHIIDLDSGTILYVARGKKKQVVYDFIEHVGAEWMSHVEAVACDMNSDFQEAFQEKCPHIKVVFDHFHIVQNLNKYINNIRKDEIKRLIDEGKPEEADELKGMKFILSSSRETLKSKDGSSAKSAGTNNDNSPEKIYDNLIEKNRLLLICDFIKEALKRAFSTSTKEEMTEELEWIIQLCEESENKHLKRFAKLISNHMDGIVSHVEYQITSGKIEGINNKIKTIRRMHYGLPDDDYFFLTLLDINKKSCAADPLFQLNGPIVFEDSSAAA